MVTTFKFWFYFKILLIWRCSLAKNADPDKYIYTGYVIGFDSRPECSLLDGSVGKNVIVFGVDELV